jgi:hypothetical protein
MGVLLIPVFPLELTQELAIGVQLRGGGRPAADIHRGQSQEHVKRNFRVVIHA